MARTPKKTTPPKGAKPPKDSAPGDNSKGLTEEEYAALQAWHDRQTRDLKAKADIAAQVAAAARKAVNQGYSLARGELGYTRKDFEEVQAAADLTEEAYQAQERARAQRHARHGLTAQLELPGLERRDTIDEKALAHADGARAYRAGKDPIPPPTVHPAVVQDWMAGWQEEQKATALKMTMATEVRDRLAGKEAKKKPTLAGGDASKAADLAGPTGEEAKAFGGGPSLAVDNTKPAGEGAGDDTPTGDDELDGPKEAIDLDAKPEGEETDPPVGEAP